MVFRLHCFLSMSLKLKFGASIPTDFNLPEEIFLQLNSVIPESFTSQKINGFAEWLQPGFLIHRVVFVKNQSYHP